MVGGLLLAPPVAETTSVKLLLALAAPSLTLKVISEVPAWSGAGVTVTARAVSVPDSTIADTGTITEFDATAETTRLLAGVSRSATENGIGPVELPWSIVKSAIDEIDGTSF